MFFLPSTPPSLSITPQVSRTVCPSHRQSVHHPCTSIIRTVCPPSRHSVHDSSVHHPNRQSCETSVRLSVTITPSAHHPTTSVRPSATITPSVQCTNQSVSLSVTSRLSDRHYDSSAHTCVIHYDSPYPRFKPIPSSCELGAITHDSPYTRFEPIPSSREWGAILQGQEIP